MILDRPCRPTLSSSSLHLSFLYIHFANSSAFSCQSDRFSDDIPAQRTPHPDHIPHHRQHHSAAGVTFLLATSVASCNVRLGVLVLKAFINTPLCLFFMIPIAGVNIGGPSRRWSMSKHPGPLMSRKPKRTIGAPLAPSWLV